MSGVCPDGQGLVPWLDDGDVRLYLGDAREVLAGLPAASVDCAATSPPFYGLRDYGVDGQIGLEATPDEWVASLVAVFRELRRVLKPTGTLWVECGDSYAGKPGGEQGAGGQMADRAIVNAREVVRGKRIERSSGRWGSGNLVAPGLKPKDLLGQPWLLAFALRADGWYLRQCIIWHKPNCMPESATDRCTTAHSYVFLLSRSARYWFDADAIAEAFSSNTHSAGRNSNPGADDSGKAIRARYNDDFVASTPLRHVDLARLRPQDETLDGSNGEAPRGPDGRRATHVKKGENSLQHRDGDRWPNDQRHPRSVWTVPTRPYSEAHFATWPEALAERIIKAGCPERICAKCSSPVLLSTRGIQSGTTPPTGLPSVRGGLPAPASGESALLQEVCVDDYGSQSGVNAGLVSGPEGLHLGSESIAPDGIAGGIRDAASPSDGRAPWSATDDERGCPPQECSEGRQPDRESRSDAQAATRLEVEPRARANGALPELRDALPATRACGQCGADLTAPGSLRPGVVLDPFSGTGTTALVARRHGRRSINIELSEDYCRLFARRLQQLSLLAGQGATG